MPKTVLHVCTGCGKENKLDPRKKHYCDCNPSAKFVFMVKTDMVLARGVVVRLLKQGT